MDDIELFNLLHLADSSLPVGSFAYSLGLEAMAKHGQLLSVQDLSDHLDCHTAQACSFDIPILHSLFRQEEFQDALHHYHLCSRIPALRRAAETQGRAWLRLMRQTHPWLNMDQIEDYLRINQNPPYFLAVFALLMSALNISIDRASQLYLYCGLRDQVTCAIRLGLVGPGLGHSILSRQIQCIPDHLKKTNKLHFKQAVRSSAVIDVAQLSHAQLYSKQFQN